MYNVFKNFVFINIKPIQKFVSFQEIADKEIKEFPLNSAPVRIHDRCMLTSRPRAVLKRWRVSRIMFRHLADYNNLSGYTRSSW